MDHEPCEEPIPQTGVSVMESGALTDERATHGVATPKEIGGSPSATATSSMGVSSAVDTDSTVAHDEEPPHKKQKVDDDEATAKSVLALSTPFAEPLKVAPPTDTAPPTTAVVLVPLAAQDPTPEPLASTQLPISIVSSVESALPLPSSLHDDLNLSVNSSATPITRLAASPSSPRIVSPAEDVDMENNANTDASPTMKVANHVSLPTEVSPSTVEASVGAAQAVQAVVLLHASPEKSTVASAAGTRAPDSALGQTPHRPHSEASVANEFVTDAAAQVDMEAVDKAEPSTSLSVVLVGDAASMPIDASPSAQVMSRGSDMKPPAEVASASPVADVSTPPPPVEDAECLEGARRAGAPAVDDVAVKATAQAPSIPSSGASSAGPVDCLPDQPVEPSTPSTEVRLPPALSPKEAPILPSAGAEPMSATAAHQRQPVAAPSSVVAEVSPEVAAPVGGVAAARDGDAIDMDKKTSTGPRIHPTDANICHDEVENSAAVKALVTSPTLAPRKDTSPLLSIDNLQVPTKQPLESPSVSVQPRSPLAPTKLADHVVLRTPLGAAVDLVVMSQTSSTGPAKPPQDEDPPEWRQRIKKELAADAATPSRPPRGSNPVWILDSPDASSPGAQAMSQPTEKDRKRRLKRKRQSAVATNMLAAEGVVASKVTEPSTPGDGSGATKVRRRTDTPGDVQPGPNTALLPSPRPSADAVAPETTSSERNGKDARGTSDAAGGKRPLESAKPVRRKSVGSTASPAPKAIDLTTRRVGPAIQSNGLAGRLAHASQAAATARGSRGSSDEDEAEVPTRPQRKKAKGKAARPSPPVEIVIDSGDSDDDDDDDEDFIVSPALNLSTDPSASSLLATSSSSDNEAIVVMVLPSTKPTASSPWRATRSSTEKGRAAKRRRGRPRKHVEAATVDLSQDGPTTVVLVDDSDESDGDRAKNSHGNSGPPPSPDPPLASLEDLLPAQAADLPEGIDESANALALDDEGLDEGVDVDSLVADLPMPSLAHEFTAPTLTGHGDNATNVVSSVLEGLDDEDEDDISNTLSIALGEAAPTPSVAASLADDPNTLARPLPFPSDEVATDALQQDAPASVHVLDAEPPLEPLRVEDTLPPQEPLPNEAIAGHAISSASVKAHIASVAPEQEPTHLGEEVVALQQPLDGLEPTLAIQSTAAGMAAVTVDAIQTGTLVATGDTFPEVATAVTLSEGVVTLELASNVSLQGTTVAQDEAETDTPDGRQPVDAAERPPVDPATDVKVSLGQGPIDLHDAPPNSDESDPVTTSAGAVDECAEDITQPDVQLKHEPVASAEENTAPASPLPAANDSSPPSIKTIDQPDAVPQHLDGHESPTEESSAPLEESCSTSRDSPTPVPELVVPTVAGDLSPPSIDVAPATPVPESVTLSSTEPEAAVEEAQPLAGPAESTGGNEIDTPRPDSPPSAPNSTEAPTDDVLQQAPCQSNLIDATAPQPPADVPLTSPTLDMAEGQFAVPSDPTEPIVKVEPGAVATTDEDSVALGGGVGTAAAAEVRRRRRRKRPPPVAVPTGAAIDLTCADAADTSTAKGAGDDGMSSSDGYLSENDMGDSESDGAPADMDAATEDEMVPPSSSPAAPFFPGPRKEVASYVAAYTEPEVAAPPTPPPRAGDGAPDQPPRVDDDAIEDVPPSLYHRPQFPCKESLIAEAFDESENDRVAEREASDSDDDKAPPPPPPGPPSPPPRRRAVVDLTDTPPPASPLRLQAKQLPPHIYNANPPDGSSSSSSSSSNSSSSDSEDDDRPPSPPHDHPFRYAKQVADLLVSDNEAENDDANDDANDDEVEFGGGDDHHSDDDQIESDSSDVVLVGVIPAPSSAGQAAAADPVVPPGESLHPVLRGTYQVAAHEATWTGTWGFSETSPAAPTKFSYKCVAPHWSAHDVRVPMNGVYNGYFLVLGEGHGRPQRVLERGVELEFTELAPGSYVVDGTGRNKFGPFSLRGYFQWGNPLTLVKMYTPTA